MNDSSIDITLTAAVLIIDSLAKIEGFSMSDSAYAAFIEDCVQERASLIGLIEAIENKMLAPRVPIAIPEAMETKMEATFAAFKDTVAQLNILIDAYEADPDAK